MKPLISIIVPAYNIEAYLARTLDSIIAQSYENIEIIVVDDGSKDGTGAILDEYTQRDARILAIHKENGGVSAARRDGILASHGDYIGFVDGDDIIDPDMYQRLLNNLLEYNADISHCGHQVHKLNSSKIEYFGNDGSILCENAHDALVHLLQGYYQPGLCNKLYKRNVFLEFLEDNTMDLSIRMFEDLLMNFYLFQKTNIIVYESFCPYHYIKREGSATTCKPALWKYIDPVRVNTIMYERSIGTDLETLTRKALISQLVHIYGKVISINGTEFAEYAKELRIAIQEQKKHWHLLPLKQKIAAYMIVYSPWLFGQLNRLYHS